MGRRAAAATAGALATVLVVGAGYATADAYDMVPGVLTLTPVPSPQAAFPTPPGAVAAPAVTPVLAELDPTAPLPDATEVDALVQDLVADPRMGTSVGVVIADALTGQVIVDQGGATPRTPASTAKLLTALAVMTALGPDRTLATTVVQAEAGHVVLVGGGDMMLAAGAGDPDAAVGHAGLADLAAATARSLTLAGTTTVTLDVDDTLFSGPGINPSWKTSDVNAGYVAAVAPLAVNIAKTLDEPYPPRFADPALNATQVFAAALAAQGITVSGTPGRATAPDGAVELARVESAPLRDVVRYAVQVSDNTITEVLGRLVAIERGLPASFQGATSSVLAEVASQGVDVTGARLADCSGLATGSVLPTRLLTDLLLLAVDPDEAALLPVLTDLPVAGWLGTLSDRFLTGPAQGLLRAKTGSLPGVTSLAGTVQTQDDRLLVFAVIADATPAGGQAGPRAAVDDLLQEIAGCGCQGS